MRYDALLIDVDGVVKVGTTVLAGVPRAIAALRSSGVPFLLVTNNSTLRPADLVRRLSLGGLDIRPEEILTSAQVLVYSIGHSLTYGVAAKRGVLVIGEDGLKGELQAGGYRITENSTDGLVAVGLDRSFNYEKLRLALRSVKLGARILATNTDSTYPSEEEELPGAGAMVAAIRAFATSPVRVMGKPSRVFFRAALSRLGMNRSGRVLIVGDRPETDVRLAKMNGAASALVLSGVTSASEARALIGGMRPDYVFRSLEETVKTSLGIV